MVRLSVLWEQSWPNASQTWKATPDGVLGDELRALDTASVDRAREHFLDAWRSATNDRATDSQAALLALAGTFG